MRIGSPQDLVDRIIVVLVRDRALARRQGVDRAHGLGHAIRAVAYDREAAAMMGINVDRTISVAFFASSVVAGMAGVMFGLLFSQVWFQMGFAATLKGFTAAVIGGIGNLSGAVVGGLRDRPCRGLHDRLISGDLHRT